jgi:hypothetical protein
VKALPGTDVSVGGRSHNFIGTLLKAGIPMLSTTGIRSSRRLAQPAKHESPIVFKCGQITLFRILAELSMWW